VLRADISSSVRHPSTENIKFERRIFDGGAGEDAALFLAGSKQCPAFDRAKR